MAYMQYSDPGLPPVPQPIGIHGNFIARQTETIILREKKLSLSGDSFEINLANKTPLLKVQGSTLSLSGRKSVMDIAGNHLFDIQKEHFHIHTTFAINSPQGIKLAEVKSGFTILGSKATITFTSSTGKPEVLKMTGNFFDTAQIIDQSTGVTVAEIDRKFANAGEIFFGNQTYKLRVAPGVDMALMAAACICLDEKRNEGGGGLIS